MPSVRRSVLVVLSLPLALSWAASLGCPARAPAPADAGPAKVTAPPSAPRPPYPNMATAAWGQRVLEERAQDAPPMEGVTGAAVLDVLHDLSPGSEARAAELAVSWYGVAAADVDRANAVALLAAALVLDPTVEGYKERLTDAWGLAAYAGTIDASDSLGQSARAMVGAAAGSVEQAKRLVEVVATTPKLGGEPRLFLALARRLTGERSDAMIDDMKAALAARPGSTRARALLAETWLDLGLFPEAIETARTPAGDTSHPWLDAVRGRALVLDGKLDEGVALLKASESRLEEGRRGDALYWLARSLTQGEAPAAEVQAIAASLGARAGFAREAAVLQALLAQKGGDYGKARALLEPLVKGPPSLPVDADATWLLADACAGLGDLACVDRAGARGLAIDGDEARLHKARAAAALVGKATLDPASALAEAHRASPFDPQLAAKVGEELVPAGGAQAGGPERAAARLRAARRALVRQAPAVVDLALAGLAEEPLCRVCRALDAAAASGIDAAQKGARALDGKGPALSTGDLVRVIDALGAAPVEPAKKALAELAADEREPVRRALARARADHADPDARRRRDAGEASRLPEPSPSSPAAPAPGAHDHGHAPGAAP